MNKKIQLNDLNDEKSLIDVYTEPLEYMSIDELSDLQDRIRVTIFLKSIRNAMNKINAMKHKKS